MAYALYCPSLPDLITLSCTEGWQAMPVSEPFDVSTITAIDIATVFGAGFFMTLPLFAAAFGFSKLLTSIRRL